MTEARTRIIMLNTVLFFAFCCFFVGGTVPAWAAPHISDFSLGMSSEDGLKRMLEPCQSAGYEALCGKVNFGDATWDGLFLFSDKDAKEPVLVGMTFFGPGTNAMVEAAFKGFAQSPYVLIYCETDIRNFSFVEQAKAGKSKAEMDAAFQEFLGNMHKDIAETLRDQSKNRNATSTFGRRGGKTEADSSSVTYMYTLPEIYSAMKETERSDLAKRFPDGVLCLLAINSDGVSLLIGTLPMVGAYLIDPNVEPGSQPDPLQAITHTDEPLAAQSELQRARAEALSEPKASAKQEGAQQKEAQQEEAQKEEPKGEDVKKEETKKEETKKEEVKKKNTQTQNAQKEDVKAQAQHLVNEAKAKSNAKALKENTESKTGK